MLPIILALTIAPALTASPEPTITSPRTCGGSHGELLTITFLGKNLFQPTAIILDALIVEATFSHHREDHCTTQFKVPNAMIVGMHSLRLATTTGISNLVPFSVDDLPAIAPHGDMHKRDGALPLTGPCTVVNTATAENSDFYKLPVKANERWTFEMVGRRLGSPIDPVLILHDAKTGRELPGLYADDTLGLQSDARLTHTFTRTMEVLIEVRDTTYRGGTDFTYRLRVGDFPNAIGTVPLAVSDRSAPTELLSDDKSLKSISGASSLISPVWATRSGPCGWGVSANASEMAEAVENGDNDTFKAAAKLDLPCGITACFEKKNDRDCWAVLLKKGDKVRFVAEAAEFALPTEVLLKLCDGNDKEVAQSDAMKLPAAIDYTAPADGRYVIAAEHLNFGWGKTEYYHLVAKYREPDATVSLGKDHLTLPGKLPVIALNKLESYDGAIDLRWDGDETIVVNATIPPKTNPTAAAPYHFALAAKPGTKPGVYFGRIVSQVKGRTPHRATTTDVLKVAYPSLAVLAAEMNGVIAVYVP